MTKHDRIIAELVNALDLIAWESAKTNGNLAYINGVAAYAIATCNASRVRNADGYLVVKES